jgi:arsenate reductase (thioredoxin)
MSRRRARSTAEAHDELSRLLQVNVLFVCVGNSGRSVMAERLFRQAAAGRHASRSAGSAPHGSGAESAVVEALREVGIDASDHVQHRLEDTDIAWTDAVIAACDGACPVVTGKRYENWGISDLYGLPVESVRPIRDEIAQRVDELLAGF